MYPLNNVMSDWTEIPSFFWKFSRCIQTSNLQYVIGQWSFHRLWWHEEKSRITPASSFKIYWPDYHEIKHILMHPKGINPNIFPSFPAAASLEETLHVLFVLFNTCFVGCNEHCGLSFADVILAVLLSLELTLKIKRVSDKLMLPRRTVLLLLLY